LREGGTNVDDRIRRAYKIVLAREPKESENDRARSFLNAQAERIRQDKSQRHGPAAEGPSCDGVDAVAWIDFSLALLNSNEFLYVP
jgi:hypothetical protein